MGNNLPKKLSPPLSVSRRRTASPPPTPKTNVDQKWMTREYSQSTVSRTPPPKTLLDKPWRDIGVLNEDLEKKMIEQVNDCVLGQPGQEVKNARLIMLGPVSAGKSSYINTIATVDKGDVATVSMAGSDVTSLSRKLTIYRPFKKLRGFRLIDTMGVEESAGRGFHVKDLTYLIGGHIKSDYKFNPASPVSESDKAYVKSPKKKDKAHCVVFVMDSRVVASESISEKTQQKIDQLQEDIKGLGIQRILILTNIDRLCPEVSKDIQNTFRSVKVKQAVDQGSKVFGLPEMNIFPVENYHREVTINPLKNILALSALKTAINFSSDYMRMQAQQEARHSSSEDED